MPFWRRVPNYSWNSKCELVEGGQESRCPEINENGRVILDQVINIQVSDLRTICKPRAYENLTYLFRRHVHEAVENRNHEAFQPMLSPVWII